MTCPTHLLSKCIESLDICYGGCGDSERQDPATGRWFITMGHPGFNSAANNRQGYSTKSAAHMAMTRYTNKRNSLAKW